MDEAVSVRHDETAHQFCITREGAEAFLLYRRQGAVLDLYYTYVPEVFRGRGDAARLCRAAFEFAKLNRLTVIPSCSYISGMYLKRYPEYRVLLYGGSDASAEGTADNT